MDVKKVYLLTKNGKEVYSGDNINEAKVELPADPNMLEESPYDLYSMSIEGKEISIQLDRGIIKTPEGEIKRTDSSVVRLRRLHFSQLECLMYWHHDLDVGFRKGRGN